MNSPVAKSGMETCDELWELILDTQASDRFTGSQLMTCTNSMFDHYHQVNGALQSPRAEKTKQAINEHFHWPGIDKDLLHYVCACVQCQIHKSCHWDGKEQQWPREPNWPFDTIALNVMWPYSKRPRIQIICDGSLTACGTHNSLHYPIYHPQGNPTKCRNQKIKSQMHLCFEKDHTKLNIHIPWLYSAYGRDSPCLGKLLGIQDRKEPEETPTQHHNRIQGERGEACTRQRFIHSMAHSYLPLLPAGVTARAIGLHACSCSIGRMLPLNPYH
ncbi:hypothetical protein PR048_012878 [Dryococelus australis]|uniref:Integrase zinc-binding domain-containing protein n=1 Tax=Dryococelus australis TaxID=614101 RepID=A0ABQ9HQM2_9NEOP|nr:hypothetical protein PR048_012878 [Dryococelus australis]